MVTTIVPKGKGPFATWEASAIDVMKMKRRLIDEVTETDGTMWSKQGMLWFAEKYNGMGYRSKHINSPYLWAGTTAYAKGGFPRDGHYDPEHVVKNIGVAVFIFDMQIETNHGVNFVEDFDDA